MIESQHAASRIEKVQVVDKIKFQNSKTCIRLYKSKIHHQQIMAEQNKSTVISEERNTNLDNVIRSRPSIVQQRDIFKHNSNRKNQK